MLHEEPEEYDRISYLLAINEQLLIDLDDYMTGTDDPPVKAIQAPNVPLAKSCVPQAAIAEYRTILVRYGEKLRADLSQYRRVKIDDGFGQSEGPKGAGRSKSKGKKKRPGAASTGA